MVHADGETNRDMGRTWQASHWHTDVSCVEEPPMGSVLHMQTVPPYGGDTLFASMSAAYDALSDRMKVRTEACCTQLWLNGSSRPRKRAQSALSRWA